MQNIKSVRLAYGSHGIEMKTADDWNVKVIEPQYIKGLEDPEGEITRALSKPIGSAPLNQLVKSKDKIAIIFNDITRPTPNKLIIETILHELKHVPASSIILFNAAGTHRSNTEAELRQMIGDHLYENFRIVQNNAFEESQSIETGISSFGNKILINRELMSCNIKILTGFIEPHFFAGFSGGGKAVMPGMAGFQTILGNHGAKNIGNNNASWGITVNNPVFDEVREVALMAGSSFLINVTLNREKEITAVFAGNIIEAHNQGIDFARKTAMVGVPAAFDIVVTTNSGYPLDLNLYQSVKGMSAAARIVKPGGTIIVAAECRDGFPDHGLFTQLLRDSKDPKSLLESICTPGYSRHDQWQAQILAQIQLKADLYMYTGFLSDEQLKIARIKRCNDIYELVEKLRNKNGKNTSICILPEGPQTIPFLHDV